MKLNEEIDLKTQSALTRSKPAKVKAKDVKQIKPKVEEITRNAQPEEEPVRETADVQIGQPKPMPPIPKTLERKNLSSEGLIKFLKSKVTILQDEVDVQQKEKLKKSEELHRLQQQAIKVEQQCDQLNSKNNSLQAELRRAEEKIIELELKVKERDNDTMRLGKEGEVSRRDMKMLQTTTAALEKRLLNRQNEIEALKVSLAGACEREKEVRDQSRVEKDCAEKQIAQLRRQRVSLLTAYKQQLMLMDNLKRQNVCLEEAKMLEFSEKEFIKILNWEK